VPAAATASAAQPSPLQQQHARVPHGAPLASGQAQRGRAQLRLQQLAQLVQLKQRQQAQKQMRQERERRQALQLAQVQGQGQTGQGLAGPLGPKRQALRLRVRLQARRQAWHRAACEQVQPAATMYGGV